MRLLGPSLYGRYAVILSVFAFANFLMTSGTNDAIRKFIAEQHDQEWKQAVFGYIGRVAAGLAILVAITFVAFANTEIALSLFGQEYVLLFNLLAIYAIGRQAREFFTRTLMGLQLENYSEPLKVAQRFTFASLALTAVFFGYGVAGVLVADIVTSGLIVLLAGVVVSRHLNIRNTTSFDPGTVSTSTIRTYIGSTVLLFGFMMSLYHVDVLILQHYWNEELVGYYKGALVIAETLWFAPIAIQLALLQRVSSQWERGEIDKIQRQAKATTRFSISITLLIALGIVALADEFIPLYLGDEFRPTILPLLLLLPGVIGFAAARPTLAINQARRSLRPVLIATGACAVLNLVLNLLLVPRFGMTGAAVSTSIGYASLIVSQSIAANSIGYNPLGDLRIRSLVLTCIVSSVPIFSLDLILSDLAALGIVPLVGFFVFSTTALVTGLVKPGEIDEALSILPSNLKKYCEQYIYYISNL